MGPPDNIYSWAGSHTHIKEIIGEIKEHLPDIEEQISEFRDIGRSQSATFAYWGNFIESIDTLLHLLRAEHDADFELHLTAVNETLPWFKAAGRNIYFKFTPVYLAEMNKLNSEQPDLYNDLLEGGFVVRRSEQRKFNSVSNDQAQTVNRCCKSQDGVIGFSRRKGALNRWLITKAHCWGIFHGLQYI